MLEEQIVALRKRLKVAQDLVDHPKAIEEYTKIIRQTLTGKANLQAILFLTNDEQGHIYSGRAYHYQKMACFCLENNIVDAARGYYRRASSDTFRALKAYPNLTEKNACRQQLREDKDKIVSLCGKRSFMNHIAPQANPEHLALPSTSTPYRLRGIKMWDSKVHFESRMDALNEEQKQLYSSKHR